MSTKVLEFILVLLVFFLGLIIGLIINSLRKRRYGKLSPEAVRGVEESLDIGGGKGAFHTPPGFGTTGLNDMKEMEETEFEVEEEMIEKRTAEDIAEGAWVCPKCGARDASLIHRKGCNKCYNP